MLSPVKAITVGALVFAIGGAFLIAQPFQQQSSVPGAEAGQQTALVIGTMLHDYSSGYDEESTFPDGINERQRGSLTGTVKTSDARLTGDVIFDWTLDFVPVSNSDEPAELNWATVSIETGEGRWEGQNRCVPTLATDGTANPCFFELAGKDAYEGLSAVLAVTDRLDSEDEDIEVFKLDGLIFAGNLPPDR